MYCPRCGEKVAPDLTFCTNCGTRMPQAAPTAEPSSAIPAAAPTHAAFSPAPGATTPTAAAATVVKPHRRYTVRIVAAVIVALLVILAGTAAVLGTRGLLPWQKAPVPTLDQVAGKQGATVDSLTADQVEAELKSEGFQTSRSQQYSGKSAGAFLSFSNVKEGQVIHRGDTIGIVESLGPGVPSGTVGTNATDSAQTLTDMNVPVTYRAVYTSGASVTLPASASTASTASSASSASGQTVTLSDGVIAGTYPADGQPVTDAKSGITVAVATTQGSGIPVDYYGQDPSTVQSDLESRGYTVALKAKFSTKANVGKVVASYPALGTADVPTSESVILFYGVDSSSTKDVFTDPNVFSETPEETDPTTLSNKAGYFGIDGVEAAYGVYCKKDGSDCKTLGNRFSSMEDYHGYLSDSGTDAKYAVTYQRSDLPALFVCASVQTNYPCLGEEQYGTGDDLKPLVYGDTGAFEITEYRQLSTVSCNGRGTWNKNLAYYEWQNKFLTTAPFSSPSLDASCPSSGTFDMNDDWYVYVPVGADIQAVEDAGYFDSAALQQAEGEQAPDDSTPYIVVRDSSQYDSTSDPLSNYSQSSSDSVAWYFKSPFVEFLGNPNRVGMKPAPSDSSVYYLVEDPFSPSLLDSYPAMDSADALPQGGDQSQDMSKLAGSYMASGGAGAAYRGIIVAQNGTVRRYSSDWDAEGGESYGLYTGTTIMGIQYVGDTTDTLNVTGTDSSGNTTARLAPSQASLGLPTGYASVNASGGEGGVMVVSGSPYLPYGRSADYTPEWGTDTTQDLTFYPEGTSVSVIGSDRLSTLGMSVLGGTDLRSAASLPYPCLITSDGDGYCRVK